MTGRDVTQPVTALRSATNDHDPSPGTPYGDTRGVILDQIASRVGQVPDLHPRLLEGIEAAAVILAAPSAPAERGGCDCDGDDGDTGHDFLCPADGPVERAGGEAVAAVLALADEHKPGRPGANWCGRCHDDTRHEGWPCVPSTRLRHLAAALSEQPAPEDGGGA